MLEVTTPTSALFALDACRVESLFATAMVRTPQAIRTHLENAKNMSTVLKNLDYLTTSAEEIWGVLKHLPDSQLKTVLSILRGQRRPIYNRLLSFRFGVGVYPNHGFFKANPAANADDAYFVSTEKTTLPRSHSLKCVANEDAGYAMAVDQLGLAGFFREELNKSDAAAGIADADSPATRVGMRASSKVDNKYTYFVSYTHTGVNGRQLSFGNAEVVRDAPVQSMEDVEEMGDVIADIDEPVRAVVVLNWQVLRSPASAVTSG